MISTWPQGRQGCTIHVVSLTVCVVARSGPYIKLGRGGPSTWHQVLIRLLAKPTVSVQLFGPQVCPCVGVGLPEGVGPCGDFLPAPAGADTGGSEIHPNLPLHR